MNTNEITINGEVYVKKSSIPVSASASPAPLKDSMKYCIVRTYSAGVFAGYIESRNGQEVVIRNVRRIWYWDGACSLSQLAKDGPALPDKCKFAVEVDKIEVLQAIEIIECTAKAMKAIREVKEWAK